MSDDPPLRRSRQIQGDVLAPFQGAHRVFLLTRFPSAGAGRSWLRRMAPCVSSTHVVRVFNECDRGWGGTLRGTWTNLGLTFAGLSQLAPDHVSALGRFTAFRLGPADRAHLLGDTGDDAPRAWEFGGPTGPRIDAIVSVSASAAEDLATRVGIFEEIARQEGIEIVAVQTGRVLEGALEGHEHFGFRDGISQPAVDGFSHATTRNGRREARDRPGAELIAPGQFVCGLERDPHASPLRVPAWMHHGSFMVFRRLAQDVERFRTAVAELAGPEGPLSDEDGELVGARLVGRWKDGSPLSPSNRSRPPSPATHPTNDFDFQDDRLGHTTPRFAHIRKMNPRTDPNSERQRRVLRRGIPYGPPYEPGDVESHATERGLLFVAYMASIEEQFEFLQRRWANVPGFPSVVDGTEPPDDGVDPIIGRGRLRLRARRAAGPDVHFAIPQFVRTKGAVYAFVPSIGHLERLGHEPD